MLEIKIDELDETLTCWTLRDVKKYLLNREEDETDEVALNNLFKTIIKKNIESSIEDKMFILLKARSIIFGDLVNDIEYTCDHCKKPVIGYYSIKNSLKYTPKKIISSAYFKNIVFNNRYSIDIENTVESIDNNNDKKYILNYLDNMSIKDINSLINEINKYVDRHFYVFNPEVVCPLCNRKTIFSSSIKSVIDLTLNTTLEKIYKLCVELKLKCNFSIDEVLDMLPFEKDVYLNIINSERENG